MAQEPAPSPDRPAKKRTQREKERDKPAREGSVTTSSTSQATTRPPPPPQPVPAYSLVPFKSAPFPYDGTVPPDDKPFFDLASDGQRGRTSRSGTVYWERATYSDRRVLIHVPKGFNIARPAVIVLFLHGHGATLARDVAKRQAVPRQVELSGLNAILVAPQLAYDAADSSPGKLWEPGALKSFLSELETKLGPQLGGSKNAKKSADAIRRMPIVMVAYSGGYLAAAWTLHHGGATERIIGVVVLDGMYGEQGKFADWISKRRGFFVSAYGDSSAEGNAELRKMLPRSIRDSVKDLPGTLSSKTAVFLPVPPDTSHHDFVTSAWTDNPLRQILASIPGYPRQTQRRAER